VASAAQSQLIRAQVSRGRTQGFDVEQVAELIGDTPGTAVRHCSDLWPRGWFRPVLRLLVTMRRLRGTRCDPFGRTEVRRLVRELIRWYEGLVDEALGHLSPETVPVALQLLASPDRIRGYVGIKLRNARTVREHVAGKRGELPNVAATA
jgi:hypothetical protein